MYLSRTLSPSAIVLSLGTLSFPLGASAESGKELVGAWMTVSAISRDGDKEREIFGANPKGLRIFDVSGRFAIIAMRNDLPKIASNNRQTATAEERQYCLLRDVDSQRCRQNAHRKD